MNVIRDCASLASGTIATLTGHRCTIIVHGTKKGRDALIQKTSNAFRGARGLDHGHRLKASHKGRKAQ